VFVSFVVDVDRLYDEDNIRICDGMTNDVFYRKHRVEYPQQSGRVFVVNDIIVGINFPTTGKTDTIAKIFKPMIDKEMVINHRFYNFLRNVIGTMKDVYPDYLFARIDIVADCPLKYGEYDNLTHDLFSSDYDGNIYLNEIEPLGSGKKADAIIIVKDSMKDAVGTIQENKLFVDKICTNVYEALTTQLTGFVESNDPKEKTGGGSNPIVTHQNMYKSNKSNYLKLSKMVAY
jgi:hypothetical protein